MLYALFCHQVKPSRDKQCSDMISIFLRISYLWHSITSQTIKIFFCFCLYSSTFNGKTQGGDVM